MKRYFAHAGYIYYPSQGMGDFIGDFDTADEAWAAVLAVVAEDAPCPMMYGAVWDSELRTNIYSEDFDE